jgi:murein DD-endopeptidase MepM/ murein hydrolase activator NlpD
MMAISRRTFMTTISAGVVTGLSGHLDLFRSRQPEFLSYLGQQPSGTALGDTSNRSTPKPALLGSNDVYWLVTYAYAAAIAACEGTLLMGQNNKMSPYHTAFDYRELTSLADHPRTLYPFWDSVRQRMDATTAAGAYQIIESTWDKLHSQYDFWYPGEAFSAANQDLAFCYLHHQTRASAELMAGVKVLNQHISVSFKAFARALACDGREWASLPDSPIGKPTGQSTRSMWQAWSWFQWALWTKCGYRRAITHPIGADKPKTDTLRWRADTGQMHWGEDYATKVGTPILAPEDGTISLIRYEAAAGHILCFVPQGYPELEIVSFHCTGKYPHPAGAAVKRGTVIGYTGESGKGSGPHWHVEIRIDGMPIEPSWYLGMASWFK